MTFQAPRQLALTGGCNLRDLGGYETMSGGQVRRGVLFRSGVLTYLTPSDFNCVAREKIRTIVDLRSQHEIATEPTLWPLPVRNLAWPDSASLANQAQMAAREQATTEAATREWIIRGYATMHEWLAHPLQGILRAVVEDEIPVLFHCAAGKDRTGFCAGMILGLLGVDEATILRDFTYTDVAVDLLAFTRTHRGGSLGLTDEAHPIDKMDPGVRAAMLRADPAYLKSALDAVNAQFGSIEGYARTALGLSDKDLEVIRYQLVDD